MNPFIFSKRPSPLATAIALGFMVPVTYAQDQPTKTLAQIVVAGHSSATQQGALRSDVLKTETINAQEISKTGATNLPELMSHRPGIDTQVECSVCNVRNITLNNLPGRFTTLLLDGVPIFSSVSNAYGLDMIGLNGLERIDISRGAGTSLIAPDSLAGTVNLVTKRPTKDGAEFDLSGGNFGYRKASVYATKTFNGGALTFNGTEQKHNSVDAVDTGISQYAGYNRQLAGLGLFLDDLAGFKIKARYDHIDEKRMGGPLGNNYDAVRASTSGNPFDFSQGPHASSSSDSWINPSDNSVVGPYNDGLFGLAQIIYTKRDQFVGTAERKINDDTKLRLATGYAKHKQDSWYGGDADYFGKQQQYYLESSVQTKLDNALITAGANYRFEDLHSVSISQDPSSVNFGVARTDTDTYTYRTPGVFIQSYQTFLDSQLEANASLRYDKNNEYGAITTPRLNMLWHHTDNLSSRVAFGQGYRLPTSFFELEHAILSVPAVDRSQAKAEKSNNLSYALNYANDRIAITTSLNHTRINNMALFIDDTQNSGNFLLKPAASAYTINNMDIVGTWQATPADAITAGLEHYQYQFNTTDMQGSLFARPNFRATLMLDHEAGPWDINVRATLTGPQDLAKFYDYANSPRYNLDGSSKPNNSPSFWSVDARTSYTWNKNITAYLGVNNLFNYEQATKDSFLWLDSEGGLDVTHIWGPNIGRTVVAGIKLGF